jgi:hypothetical protein
MDYSAQSTALRQAIDLLSRAVEKLDQNDPFSAEVMLGVTIHLLENSKADLNHYLETETRLRKLLGDQLMQTSMDS